MEIAGPGSLDPACHASTTGSTIRSPSETDGPGGIIGGNGEWKYEVGIKTGVMDYRLF